MEPTSLPSGKVSRSTSRSPEIKVGDRLRYLEAPNHYWKTGSVYPILEVQKSGSFIVAVEPTAHFPEQWQPADKLGTRWEIVDEPKQDKRCGTCKYADLDDNDEPCDSCRGPNFSEWEPKA